jgi:RimJ/RimL family protein N-acetyltransferase
MFYPTDAVVPESLLTAEFLARPLKATDVELDYDAVISSRAELFLRSDGQWPREGFTLEENLADLIRHEREHLERVAFTYTVMNPAETLCLGCLYINPLQDLLQRAAVSIDGVPDDSAYVTFWVRQSRLGDSLERQLLQALVSWFQAEWAFSQVTFVARKAQERQIRLFEEMGMRLLYTLPLSAVYLPSSGK